jgi:uncharacterized membrane protein
LLLSLPAVTTIAGFLRIPADSQLPIHFDIFGRADRFAERDVALILMPATGLVVLIAFWLISRFSRFSSPNSLAGGRYLLGALLPTLLAMLLAFQTVLVFQLGFAITRVVGWSVAAILIILGNLMPKSQPNRFGGMRLDTTLADPANWAATHRFTGLAMMIAGAGMFLITLMAEEGPILVLSALAAILLPPLLGIAYSIRLKGSVARNNE